MNKMQVVIFIKHTTSNMNGYTMHKMEAISIGHVSNKEEIPSLLKGKRLENCIRNGKAFYTEEHTDLGKAQNNLNQCLDIWRHNSPNCELVIIDIEELKTKKKIQRKLRNVS